MCALESHIGNPFGMMQTLPWNNYCIPLDVATGGSGMLVMCEEGVVTTRLFSNVNCMGEGAREMNFCHPYCDDSDDSDSDSDSDAPPACLVESCSAAGVAAVEAAMDSEDAGILVVCEAVEVLHSSGCMRNCIGTDEIGELNAILNICGLGVLESGMEVLFTQVFTELEIDAFDDGAFDRQFRSDYSNTYAAAFDVSADEVEILDIKSGSVVVRGSPATQDIHLVGVFSCYDSSRVRGFADTPGLGGVLLGGTAR